MNLNQVCYCIRAASILRSKVKQVAIPICCVKSHRGIHGTQSLRNEQAGEKNPTTEIVPDYLTSLLQKPLESKLKTEYRKAEKVQETRTVSIFRTSEKDPGKHSKHHEGMFYTIDLEEFKSLFPDFISERMQDQVETLNEASIMVRQPAVEGMHILKSLDYDIPMPRLLLYGQSGCGKSMTMAHMMHYCSRNDWVRVHVPWVEYWMNGIITVSPSEFIEGRYDLPDHSKKLLAYFVHTNQHLINEFKTQHEYELGEDKIEAGTPLLELCEFGQIRVKFANAAVGALLEELKILANDKKIRLLIAIDGVNGFWCPSLQKYQMTKIHMQELSLVKIFQDAISSNTTNAVTLCTVDLEVKGKKKYKFGSSIGKFEEFTPHELLGKEGFEFLDPFVPIHVPKYSPKEADCAIDYYEEMKWMQHPRAKTVQGRKEIIFLSGYNPQELLGILDVC